MKKTLIAFAALSAIAGMAQAQSSVTLYGLVDVNLTSLKTNVEYNTARRVLIEPNQLGNLEAPALDEGVVAGSVMADDEDPVMIRRWHPKADNQRPRRCRLEALRLPWSACGAGFPP